MEEELKEIGLTEKEIRVYIACLKLGSAVVQDIAKKANTYRTYTYEMLKSLKEKGLVNSVIKSGKQYFEVSPPHKILSILKERELNMKRILPQLNALYKSVVEKPRVEFYEGKEGLKTILDDLISTNEEILVYGSTRKQLALLNFYFPNYVKRRVKAGIRIRVITEQSPETIELSKRNKEELREIAFFPKNFESPTATNIYGNKIAILSFEKEPVGIIIENEDIARTQRIVFEMLWNICKF